MDVASFILRPAARILVAGLVAACLPIPVPPHALGVVPDRDAFASLAVGMSRRADVVLTLGEPHYRLDGDRFLMYEWTVAYGYLIFGGPGAAAALPVSAPHYLCFEFAPDGRLVRKDELAGAIYSEPDKAIDKCVHPSETVDEAIDR